MTAHDQDHAARHVAGEPDALGTFSQNTTLSVIGLGVGASKPTTVIFSNVIAEEVDIGDAVYLRFEIPVDYSGGDIIVRAHVVTMSAESGKEANFQIDYKTASIGDVMSGTTATKTTGDLNLPASQYQHFHGDMTISEADLAGKGCVHVKLTRIALVGGADPAANPGILCVSFIYTANRVI